MRARSSVRPAKGTASDNAAAPGCRSRPPWGRLSRPAPGSCGNRQRRHPTHIEDEADEAPFPLRLREPAHRDGAEAEYLLDPPVARLHDRLAPLEPPSAFVGLQLPTHPLRAGTSAPLGCHALLLPLAERDVGVDLPLLQRCEVRLRPIPGVRQQDRKSTRLNSSHLVISYAVFCLKKKKKKNKKHKYKNKKKNNK